MIVRIDVCVNMGGVVVYKTVCRVMKENVLVFGYFSIILFSLQQVLISLPELIHKKWQFNSICKQDSPNRQLKCPMLFLFPPLPPPPPVWI